MRHLEHADTAKFALGAGVQCGLLDGATGAITLGTVLDEMGRQNKFTALILLYVGGGMGIATIIEHV